MGKRHKPEEIIAKLRQVEVMTGQGASTADAIRSIGVTEVTYYRWRSEYGGMKLDQVKRVKELEVENARLCKAVSDLTLDKLIYGTSSSNGEIFSTLREAQIIIESWRQHYNRVRPHSSLGYRPLAPEVVPWPGARR
jgi:putative transposase